MRQARRRTVPVVLFVLALIVTLTLHARPLKMCVSCGLDLGCGGGVDQCAEVRCEDGTWYSCLGRSRMP